MMDDILPTLGWLLQLALAGLAFIWILAYLGFVDETKRSVRANLLGKLLVGLCVLLALVPALVTLWVGWCYYFPSDFCRPLPLGFYLPVVVTAAVGLLCAGLIFLFYKLGYQQPE
jgi:hypothetical protein